MALIEPGKLRERCEARLRSLAGLRAPYESDWTEISRYCSTRTIKLLTATASGRDLGGKRYEKLLDTRGIRAHDIMANGMATGLTSPATPWFDIKTEDPELIEAQAVKEWLEDSKLRAYSFFQRVFNFYPASKNLYGDLGRYGAGAQVMLEHWKHGAVVMNLPAGSFWIGCDDGGMPDTLYRRVDMTVAQVIQKFGDKASATVKNLYDKSQLDDVVQVFHAIEPNQDREWGKRDRTNMAIRSVYWEAATAGGSKGDGILAFEGFQEQPFWAPRWDVEGGETYGVSPGMVSFPIARALTLQHLRKHQAIDYTVKPALGGPPLVDGANLVPGGYTAFASVDQNKVGSLWDVNPMAIRELREDIAETRLELDAACYADLFMAITNMRGIQPRNVEEIAARNEEKLTQLGPVVDRVQNEMLRIAVNRAFGILSRTGQLRDTPEELEGQQLKLDFISVLATMQRAVGLGAIERTLSFAGNLAGAMPGILDKIDVDQAMDEYAQRSGAPVRIVRSDDAVAEIRKQRAQAEQAEKMAAMAPAMQQGAAAAKLLSETDLGNGRSALATGLGPLAA